MRLIHGAFSDVGLVRSQNEDSFVAGPGLFAVCDGMGGALAGEVASEVACRMLMQLHPETDSVEHLRDAVRRANREILTRSIEEPGLAGMGTTLTAAVRRGDALVFVHVGDSRAYLLRAGQLRQLTDDHSLVAELVRQGRLTPEEAAVHPHRSVITRALGTEDDVMPDVITVPLEVGDRFLICSDGVSGLVPDGRLQVLLADAPDPQTAAEALVQEALAHGGDDNATAVVIFVVEDDSEGQPDGHEVRFGPERRLEHGSPVQGILGSDKVSSTARGWLRRLRGGRRVWMTVGIVVLVLVVAVAGFAAFNASVYHVGSDGDMVVLYRGLPATILGLRLFTPVEVGTVSYSHLEPYLRERVDAHELTTREEGQRFLRSLDSQS